MKRVTCYAEGRSHGIWQFVCLCVCVSLRLLCQFCSARSTVSIETYNVSRTRYYLAFEHLKVSYEALFSSYGVIFETEAKNAQC